MIKQIHVILNATMISKAVNTLSKLDILSQNSIVEAKQDLLSAIYRDKLCYDDQGLRTGLINEVSNIISLINSELK